jgi:hypothetical protein
MASKLEVQLDAFSRTVSSTLGTLNYHNPQLGYQPHKYDMDAVLCNYKNYDMGLRFVAAELRKWPGRIWLGQRKAETN